MHLINDTANIANGWQHAYFMILDYANSHLKLQSDILFLSTQATTVLLKQISLRKEKVMTNK